MQQEKLAGIALALLVLATAWSAVAVSGRLGGKPPWPGLISGTAHASPFGDEHSGDPFDALDRLSFEYCDKTMSSAAPRDATAKPF